MAREEPNYINVAGAWWISENNKLMGKEKGKEYITLDNIDFCGHATAEATAYPDGKVEIWGDKIDPITKETSCDDEHQVQSKANT